MAKKAKPKKPSRTSLFDDGSVSAEDRISRIMALGSIKGMSSGDQVTFMRAVGFSITEVARLLLISENQVSVSLSQAKNALKKGQKPKYLAARPNGEI